MRVAKPTTAERLPRRRRIARIAGLLCAASVVFAAAPVALVYLAPLPAPPPFELQAESTKIYDREGRLLYDSAGPADALYSHVGLDELPAHLVRAVIATEDEAFYSHAGIDPVAIARAAVDDLRHMELRSGASTITQQLARNLYMDESRRRSGDPLRKLQEMQLALRLERKYSKDEILETYLNRAYFGNLAYGVEAASRIYFGKSARNLDLAESALLAGLLQSPAAYNPLTRLDAAQVRQRTVLRLMADDGVITRAEAEAAAAEPLAITETPFPMQAPHFVAWVLEQLPELVGETAIAKGGLRVTTTLDLPLNDAAQAAVVRQVEALEAKNVGSGAVVALDPRSGDVLAMVGSADYFDATKDGSVNGALAERQPGSAMKPIVYAAAMEKGMTPSTSLLDVPASFQTRSGEPYAPQNYDLTFHGVVPAREALASSYNVPAVEVLQLAGIDEAFRLGQAMGLTSLRNPEAYDLSLTLGGGEVRLLDLTAAYGAFASGGLRVQPNAILRIETAAGRVLYQPPASEAQRVISESTAFLISDVLSDADARAPGFGHYGPLNISANAAVKTGTTTDFRDNWTVGYTSDLVVGVWAGNADNTSMRGVSGVDGAAPIWRDVMQAAMRTRPTRPFEAPSGIERVKVCVPSGLLPTPDCLRTRLEVFAPGTTPTRLDDYYRRGDCPPGASSCDRRVYAAVPVEALSWAQQAGVNLPPQSQASGGGTLRLAAPADGMTYSLSTEVRAADQRIPLEATPTMPVGVVEFLVNGQSVGRASMAPYRVFWPLQPGRYQIEARATTSSGAEVRSGSVTIQVVGP